MALVLIAGLVTPAFANVDEYGIVSDPTGIDFGEPNQMEEISIPEAVVDLASNGNFETGDFTDWTVFTTANGILNPAVVLFDTDGDSTATNSAQFRVGGVSAGFAGEGGGIKQTINFAGGTVTISADIAVDGSNADGGLFKILFDCSHAFSAIASAGNSLVSVSNRSTASPSWPSRR